MHASSKESSHPPAGERGRGDLEPALREVMWALEKKPLVFIGILGVLSIGHLHVSAFEVDTRIPPVYCPWIIKWHDFVERVWSALVVCLCLCPLPVSVSVSTACVSVCVCVHGLRNSLCHGEAWLTWCGSSAINTGYGNLTPILSLTQEAYSGSSPWQLSFGNFALCSHLWPCLCLRLHSGPGHCWLADSCRVS